MIDTPLSYGDLDHDRGLYFGWRIVAALFMVTFALFGVSLYSFIIFTQPLAHAFGWSAMQTGGLVSAMWLVAPLALLSGHVTKRFSAWRLIAVGLCIQAVVLVLLGLVSAYWQLYLLRIVMGFGKVMTIAAVPLLVARWFKVRFATAMAIVWAGGSAGGLVMSPATEALVSWIGWKPAAATIAGGVIVVLLGARLLAKGPSAPSEFQVQQVGQSLPEPHRARPAASGGEPQNLSEINPITAACMFVSVIGAGMAAIAVMSQEPMLLEAAGLSPSVAATLLGVTAGGALIGSVTIGWTLDRLHGLWSSLAVAGAMIVGVGALALQQHAVGFVLSAIGSVALGFGFGSGEVLWLTLTKRQFGTAIFPTTYGGWYFALQAGYAAGGSLSGWSFGHFGMPGFLGFVALVYTPPAICSVILRAARQPAPAAT